MLITYRGVIQDGKVLFPDASELPDGTEVVVVVEKLYPTVEEQEERMAKLSLREWHAPFQAVIDAKREFPAEVDMETLSDDELVELVHRLREE
jgi:hypothetical protein